MAEVEVDVAAAGVPKKRTFKKFSFRGVDLDALLDMSTDELVKLFTARARRRFQRGLKRKPMALIKKLRKAKREAPAGEKPELVKTHLRNMIIVPEMIGSVVGVYNGKTFNQIEIKPEMIGHYLAEFSISYKPVKHGRPGIGATHSSRPFKPNVASRIIIIIIYFLNEFEAYIDLCYDNAICCKEQHHVLQDIFVNFIFSNKYNLSFQRRFKFIICLVKLVQDMHCNYSQ
ncbi:unnamed protein product [Lactuca virosa]|uniref:40S ribosomal protein S15 n=1 Tax=Lactuca virosa TaxID=75947 RepID=A0AAU9MKI1_9ASTR|nr:unnamed protein product [Lactuca virosa]